MEFLQNHHILPIDQVVEELVLDSIDGGSTCVAVRLNLDTSLIQVVDNGEGIGKEEMHMLGFGLGILLRVLLHISRSLILPYKDEGSLTYRKSRAILGKIIQWCSSLEIVSRPRNTKETYRKIFDKQSPSGSMLETTEDRPSSGTTVTICGYHSMRPEKRCSQNNQSVTQQIKKLLRSMLLIHFNVSFSIRDDSQQNTSVLLFKKQPNSIAATRYVLGKVGKLFQFQTASHHFKLKGLFGVSRTERHQYFFINNRIVKENWLLDFIASIFSCVREDLLLHPVVILNVKYSTTNRPFEEGKRNLLIEHRDELLSLFWKTLNPFCWMLLKGTVGKSEWISEWINSSIPTRCALERGDGPTSPSCELVNIRKPGNRVSLDLQQNRLVNVTDVKMNSEDASLVIDSQLAQGPATVTVKTVSNVAFPSYGKIPLGVLFESNEGFRCRVIADENLLSDTTSIDILTRQWMEEKGDECSDCKSLNQQINKKREFDDAAALNTSTNVNADDANTLVDEDESNQNSRIAEVVPTKMPRIEKDAHGDSAHAVPKFDELLSTLRAKMNLGLKYQSSSTADDFWIQHKQPLNVTNSLSHSLPFYRAVPSRRCTYSKAIFEKIAVLKQVDRKFICCIVEEKGQQHVILIDQHAAHERVRLEKLMQIHSFTDSDGFIQIKSSPLHPPLEVSIDAGHTEVILKLRDGLARHGLRLLIDSKDRILVTHVPSCFLSREATETQRRRPSICKNLVENAIKESVAKYADNGALSPYLMPHYIRDVLNSLACHGAIRFGDELTAKQSIQLVRALGSCEVPFQCAHGRPLVAPLLDLGDLVSLTATQSSRPLYSRLNELSFC